VSALIDRLAYQAEARPHDVAIAAGERRLSYAALPAAVSRMAAAITAADPGRGPVGLRQDNGIDWVLADLALLQLGRVAVPLPSFFLPAQCDAALADAGASSVIEPDGTRRLVSTAARLPAGTVKISYTSGSTGHPKGICLSEAQLCATAEAVVARLGADMAGRHLSLLPLGVLLENVAGLYASLFAGGTYVVEPAAGIGLRDPFRPDFAAIAAAVERTEATSLILVPELLRGLIAYLGASGARLPTLRLVAVGGAKVPVTLLEQAKAIGLPVVQGYGLTECGSVVALERPDETLRGSVGPALNHVSLRIADDGEIIIDGNAHLGTVGQDRGPGDLRTGDIGHLDSEGRLFVTGRKSNLIITGFGRNVSPEWIEAELAAHPQIAQALVHGDGDSILSALIVPSSRTTDPTDAIAAVNEQLPPYARIGNWGLTRPFLPHDGTATSNGRPRRAAILERQRTQPFFDRLAMGTAPARFRLARVPQLAAGLRGEISLETYIAYLTQAYHHVSHTVPLMRAARARLRDRPALVTALDDYILEETGHEQWILADIAAAGGDPVAAVEGGPSAATAAMVDHAYRAIETGNPVGFFGMVFVLEGTSIALAQQGAEAVRAALGLPEAAFRYLTSHGALDQDHMRFFETLVNGLDDPADQQAIVAMADAIFDRFAGIFASIPMEPAHVVA
jgi:long-subunit acyl-CoA synthetase (AMP-forming)/pyrroloquinoline quinone (PQQ) biosynthesis protein C